MVPAARVPLSLPPGWDFARDLVVFVGGGIGGAIDALRTAGQERILVYAPPADPAERSSGDPSIAHAPGEIVLAILGLPGEIPHHVVLPPTSDPWASDQRRAEAAQAVRDALQSRRMMATTVARFGTTWLLQGLENLDLIAAVASVDALREAFAGRPCIIASPGPSLSRNVAQLAGLRGNALLMAGTHCLSALHHAGVTPHFLVAADPGDLGRHCEGIDLADVEALVVGATCRRESFQLPVGRVLSFASNGELDDWIYEGLAEDARLPTGGSVACSEFSLALLMGCDPIVFVGQDLSFPEGRYYAAGCIDDNAEVVPGDEEGSFLLRKPPGAAGPGPPMPDGSLQFSLPQRLRTVPGYAGGEVPTSQSFHAFLTWFAAKAGSLGGSPRVCNCTEGGAFIPGMEHLPLAAVARDLSAEPCDVGAILEGALVRVSLPTRRRRLADHLRQMVAALDPCLDLARRCTGLAGEARRNPARLDELALAEKQLTAALRPVRLFALVAQEEILRAQEEGRKATDLASSLAASRALFRVVERAVLLLREPLRRTLATLDRD